MPDPIQEVSAPRRKKEDPKEFVLGFNSFIRDYNVAPLAIGVVVGTAINNLVNGLVSGLVSPLISLLSPDGRLQNLQFTFHGAVFKIGLIINSTISFLMIMLIVYVVVKLILRNEEYLVKK